MSDVTFPTWIALREWITKTFTAVHDFGPDLMTFEFPKGTGTEVIGLLRHDAPGNRSWVFFGVKLGPASRSLPALALEVNFHLPIGALSVFEDVLNVGQKLPLEGLHEQIVRETIEALVGASDRLRQNLLAPDRDGAETHQHFAE